MYVPLHFITRGLRVHALEYGSEILIGMHAHRLEVVNTLFLFLAKFFALLVEKPRGRKKAQVTLVWLLWSLIGRLAWILLLAAVSIILLLHHTHLKHTRSCRKG
nr:DNA-directed RNA polymerase II protein isoform 2 [Ipomoea batatas]